MAGVWAQVDELIASGHAPLVTLSLATELPKPSKKKRAKRDPADGFKHYTISTAHKQRMWCRNPGCKNRLRSHATNIVCSEECRVAFRDRLQLMLDILDGKLALKELPMYMRSPKRAFRMKATQ